MTEELLEEARLVEAEYKHKRTNKKLMLLAVGSYLVFCIIAFIWPLPGYPTEPVEAITFYLGFGAGMLIIFSLLALIFGLIPFKKWAFKKRFRRLLWAFCGGFMGIMAFFVVLITIIGLVNNTIP